MGEVKLFNPIPKEKPNYAPIYSFLYITAFQRIFQDMNFERLAENSLDIRKKFLFFGVKAMINLKDDSREYKDLLNKFAVFSFINDVASTMTPMEFQTVFPIAKEYDGARYEVKDYFSTKQAISDMGEHEVIGDRIAEFFWDYHNWEIRRFAVKLTCVMSSLDRLQGGPGLTEQFFSDLLYPQTEYQHNGKQFTVENGEVKKKTHLQVVK